MNNLKLYSDPSLNLELKSTGEVVSFSALDIERNRLFFASSINFIYTTQLRSSQVRFCCACVRVKLNAIFLYRAYRIA